MEEDDKIVIVGAGLAGLTTSLALHRLGLKSLVLESSDNLRITGFALTLWTNAWKALDAVGIGDFLRERSLPLQGFTVASTNSGASAAERSFDTNGKFGDYESRCVKRRDLLEALVNALPPDTIRYSSKVVSIEESGPLKLVHLADGTVLRAKVLIGCDGVNSIVAKWLGLSKPVNSGRSAIRGLVELSDGTSIEQKVYIHFAGGVRFGYVPCDNKTFYWFCTFTPSAFKSYDKEVEENPMKMKQFVLSKIGSASEVALSLVERTDLMSISCAQLKLRLPWDMLFKTIVKDNVCLAGDALHPMTPDIGQGGCSALEDSVILAKCLKGTLLNKSSASVNDEYEMIKEGLKNYGKDRKWRSFSLIATAYVVGFIQESNGMVLSFLRRNWLSKYTPTAFQLMAKFDCGELITN